MTWRLCWHRWERSKAYYIYKDIYLVIYLFEDTFYFILFFRSKSYLIYFLPSLTCKLNGDQFNKSIDITNSQSRKFNHQFLNSVMFSVQFIHFYAIHFHVEIRFSFTNWQLRHLVYNIFPQFLIKIYQKILQSQMLSIFKV